MEIFGWFGEGHKEVYTKYYDKNIFFKLLGRRAR